MSLQGDGSRTACNRAVGKKAGAGTGQITTTSAAENKITQAVHHDQQAASLGQCPLRCLSLRKRDKSVTRQNAREVKVPQIYLVL